MISRVKNEHGNSENRIDNGRQEKRPMKKEKEKIREGKKKKKGVKVNNVTRGE